MREAWDFLSSALLLGAGATLVMDAWIACRKRLLHVPALDYALVGRWFAYLPRGRFRHDSIAASAPVRGERALGWLAHYVSGVLFAALLLTFWGLDWVCHPTLAPALIVGIGTSAAPFLIMQPGMGAGIAASRTARPAIARLHTLITHGVFGVGLYLAGWVVHSLVAFGSRAF